MLVLHMTSRLPLTSADRGSLLDAGVTHDKLVISHIFWTKGHYYAVNTASMMSNHCCLAKILAVMFSPFKCLDVLVINNQWPLVRLEQYQTCVIFIEIKLCIFFPDLHYYWLNWRISLMQPTRPITSWWANSINWSPFTNDRLAQSDLW